MFDESSITLQMSKIHGDELMHLRLLFLIYKNMLSSISSLYFFCFHFQSRFYVHVLQQKYEYKTETEQFGSEIKQQSLPRHSNEVEPQSLRKELSEVKSKVKEFTEQKKIDSRAIDDLSKKTEAYKKEQQQLKNDKESMKEEIQKLKVEKQGLLQR